MGKIGFKRTDEQIETITRAAHNISNINQLAESIGALKAMEVLEGYFNSGYMPFIKGERRDQMFMIKLRKIKERYFDEI